jgi:hypothetical protein
MHGRKFGDGLEFEDQLAGDQYVEPGLANTAALVGGRDGYLTRERDAPQFQFHRERLFID